ncbi:MAG: hypothetical protein IJ002_07065 [Clostridia bacterium]|nr:hypothetical protein [Clostridia bacterium]
MRSMKKIFALAMVVMMLFAFAAVNASAEEGDYSDAAQRLATINVLKGDTNGNLMLENGVTRYQAALFFVQAMTGETAVEKWNAEKQSAVFSDVPEYATAIDYAYGTGLILGRGNGVYGYNDPIIYQDMLVLGVRALGYETSNMVYPYGYIETAKTLGLTENLASDIKSTDELTRGETAQIIWNMLNIEIAEKDPISGKLIYPGDLGAAEILFSNYGITLERTTYLKEAGFSQGVVEAVITEYNEAETSSDIATVTLDNGLEIAAKDLGITARTYQETFLGLPVTLYVDCDEEEFEKLYDVVEEDSEADVIFADFLEFTNVVNVAKGGNIKVTESTDGYYRITLGSTTYKEEKYNFDVRVLGEDGWEEDDFDILVDAFSYDSKNGYTGENSYGEIDYTVVTDEVDGETVSTVLMLYKPYEFGQYFTRTYRYQPTVGDESFIAIGKYDDAMTLDSNGDPTYENADGDNSYFVEYLLGSDVQVSSSTTSVSKKNGEAARDARLSGESVRSGNFIFYYYNALDNVLEVGYNCGNLTDGKLTSYSTAKETVKISSNTYEYGFEGAFEHNLPAFSDYDFSGDYLANVSDDVNVQYVAYEGRVFYIQTPLNTSNHRVKHNYVIATVDPEIMADLLDMDVEDYEADLTADGIYVSENGNMTIAVLNTTTAQWGLAEVAQYEYGSYSSTVQRYWNGYNHEDAEWEHVVDIAKGIKNYDIFGDSFKGYDEYSCARDQLLHGGMFAVRANKSGVYNLSVVFSTGDWGMINNGINTTGLIFSDTAPKTNLIEASRAESVDPARVTINDNTVIVVIDRDGNVGVRKGILENADSIYFSGVTDSAPGFVYSASSSLIVLQLPLNKNVNYSTAILDANNQPFNVKTWGEGTTSSSTEAYYIAINGSEIEYERLDDGSYSVTVSGLFNLRTMRAVSSIKVTLDDVDETNLIDEFEIGKVLHMKKNGDLVVEDIDVADALLLATDMRSTSDDDYTEIDMSAVKFIDDCSITMDEFGLDAKTAVGSIKFNVATLDVTALDWDDYDIGKIAYELEYEDDNVWDAASVEIADDELVYLYGLEEVNTIDTVTEPTAGILDQYVIDTVGETLKLADKDDEYFENAVEIKVDIYACGIFDDDTGELIVYAVKLVSLAD